MGRSWSALVNELLITGAEGRGGRCCWVDAMDDDVKAGQAVYTPLTLRAYDAFVLDFLKALLWRCLVATESAQGNTIVNIERLPGRMTISN